VSEERVTSGGIGGREETYQKKEQLRTGSEEKPEKLSEERVTSDRFI
jgi:hypothetical protein